VSNNRIATWVTVLSNCELLVIEHLFYDPHYWHVHTCGPAVPKLIPTMMMSKMSTISSRFISAARPEPVLPKLMPIAVASVISTISSSLTSPLSRETAGKAVSDEVTVNELQAADRKPVVRAVMEL